MKGDRGESGQEDKPPGPPGAARGCAFLSALGNPHACRLRRAAWAWLPPTAPASHLHTHPGIPSSWCADHTCLVNAQKLHLNWRKRHPRTHCAEARIQQGKPRLKAHKKTLSSDKGGFV